MPSPPRSSVPRIHTRTHAPHGDRQLARSTSSLSSSSSLLRSPPSFLRWLGEGTCEPPMLAAPTAPDFFLSRTGWVTCRNPKKKNHKRIHSDVKSGSSLQTTSMTLTTLQICQTPHVSQSVSHCKRLQTES